MAKKNKVILCGYRATGKTTVGKMLAARLNIDFLDMDAVIVEEEGCSIQKMVADHDWEYFREKERGLLKKLTGQDQLVVSTGGGAIMHQDLWDDLKKTGLVVCLQADLDTIRERLAVDAATEDQRPSLTGKGLTDEIATVLKEREPLYKKGSHLSIDTAALSPEEITAAILQALE